MPWQTHMCYSLTCTHTCVRFQSQSTINCKSFHCQVKVPKGKSPTRSKCSLRRPPTSPNPTTSSSPKQSLLRIMGWSVPAGCLHTHVARTIKDCFSRSESSKNIGKHSIAKIGKSSRTRFFLSLSPWSYLFWVCAGHHRDVYVFMCMCICVSPSSLRTPLGHPSGPATRRDCADVRPHGAGQWEAPRIVSRRHAALRRRQSCRRRRRNPRTTQPTFDDHRADTPSSRWVHKNFFRLLVLDML